MPQFLYDVAISFAGEQRGAAEELAKCLRANNVAVFYDQFEDSELWGKHLYEHLSDVYRKQARYCIILASEAYSRKAWTNLERQSAQARALEEKGKEYILPVRFDSTEIPGILPTMGYLDFSRYGVEGICNAFLKKLRGSPAGTLGMGRDTVSTSSLAAILIAEKGTFLFLPVLHSRFDRETATLAVAPADPEDEHHLNAMKGLKSPVLVAFRHDVAVCRVENVTFRTTAGVGQFDLDLRILKTRFTPDLEMATSSTTKDQFAKMRTRRLLLNENPAVGDSESSRPAAHVLNDAMYEILLAGQGTITEIKVSIFPELYKHYRSDPRRFLEVAWIDVMLMLKTSACVADVERLVLSLHGSELDVDFRGRREKEYANSPLTRSK